MNVRVAIPAAVATVVLLGGFLFYLHRSTSDAYAPYDGPLAEPGTPAPSAPTTRHIALNTEPADYPRLHQLGYDLVDMKPDEAAVNALPAGMQGLLWVGNFTCGDFDLSYTDFTAAVDRLGRNPKVYGWYLSDEPNPRECPDIAGEIRRRADYLQQHAPGQKRFVSLTDWPMKPLAPKKINVDLIGLDPYPCRGSSTARPRCDINWIDRMVRMADAAGIPRRSMVPVFQTFGQACSKGEKQYWLPTADQLKAILKRWKHLTPNPVMDISYSWGRQGEWVCPGLADATGQGGHPDLQSIMLTHNED
jgi:hypothetical protein